MKTKKVNKIKMFNSLIKVLDENKKTWSKVKEIYSAYKAFIEETNNLNQLKVEYDKDLQNLIDRKSSARKNIIMQVFPLSNIIVAYAIDNKYKKLVKKYNFSKAELRKAKDIQLLEHSRAIWNETKKLYNSTNTTSENNKKNQKTVVVNIQDYGLTVQMIDKLEVANAALAETRRELKEAFDYKKQCRKKITAGSCKNIQLLKNKIDLLITIFKATNPAFYSDFVEARTIENSKEAKQRKSEKPKTNKKTDATSDKTNHLPEEIIIKEGNIETETPGKITTV